MSPRRIVYGVTAFCLLVGVSFVLDGMLTYWSFSQGESFSGVLPPRALPAAVPAPPKKDYGVIVRRNLFGGASSKPAAGAAPSVVQPSVIQAGALTMKFRLVGTTAFPGGGGFAILEDRATKVQYVHRQGENVRGTLIQQVSRGSVRLLTGTRAEVLRIFDEEEKRPPPVPKAGAAVPPAGVFPNRRGDGIRPIVRMLSRALFDRIVGAEADIKKHLRAERYRQPDGQEGIRIFPITPGGIMAILGLRAGDLILSVQGEPATDPEGLFQQLGTLAERPQTEMEILRGSRKMSMDFRIQG